MKKLILLSFFAFVFFGCSKDKKYCWECNTTVTSPGIDGEPETMNTKTTHCDLTEDEIRKVEKGATSTSTTPYGTIKTETKCKKQ